MPVDAVLYMSFYTCTVGSFCFNMFALKRTNALKNKPNWFGD